MDWADCLAETAPARLVGTLLRLVESQEQVATSQLVGSLEKQALLEEMLDRTKPLPRPDTEGLHYLLATPFRYPPLKWGSRFGSRDQPSLFYGSQTTRTVLWEAAYYRFVFWHGMSTPPARKLDSQHTLFGAAYATGLGLQLHAAPFTDHLDALTSPVDYRATQALGRLMRARDIQAFEFVSARDPERGINVALFTPRTFAQPRSLFQEAWLGEVDGARVRFAAVHERMVYDYPIEAFSSNGRLPLPA